MELNYQLLLIITPKSISKWSEITTAIFKECSVEICRSHLDGYVILAFAHYSCCITWLQRTSAAQRS